MRKLLNGSSIAKVIIAAVFVFIGGGAVQSGRAQRVPWDEHDFPFDFRFDNHFDTHQQTRQLNDGTIQGFLYITLTEGFSEEGLPVARHCGSDTPQAQCLAGWTLRGLPGSAVFVFHRMDHPIWQVGSRSDIPQPGVFSHFHWLGGPETPEDLEHGKAYDGYFIELRVIKSFAFEHAGQIIPLSAGMDMATHLNLVGSFPEPSGP